MPFAYMIDEPSDFAPLAEWRRFLAMVEELPQDDEGMKLAREIAERRIAELETGDD